MAGHGSYGTMAGHGSPHTLPPPDLHTPSGSLPDAGVSSEHSILRSGGSKRALGAPRSWLNVWELIFLPWILLVLVLVTFFCAGTHGDVGALRLIPVVLLGLCYAFTRWHYKAANNADCVLGILCMTAIVIGLVVSVYAEFASLQEYARLSRGASYANVLPTELATGKDDATTLEFTNQTRVDLSRAYGYIHVMPASAHTFCVAPIGTMADGVERRIQYFAAGLDCCGLQSNFACGEATNLQAHGGIALPDAMRDDTGYAAAIRGAEAMYGFRAADGYILVRWATNPNLQG
jgi:hypothetical protein